MSRMASILIVIAMVVTAVSGAVVLHVQFAFPLGQAVALGLAVLFGLAMLHSQMERRRDRRWLEARIAEISAVAGDVNTDVGRIAGKLQRLEAELPSRIRDENEPLAAEVEVLGHLMKQIADTMAEFEQRVDRRFAEIGTRLEARRVEMPAPPPQARIAQHSHVEAPDPRAYADPAVYADQPVHVGGFAAAGQPAPPPQTPLQAHRQNQQAQSAPPPPANRVEAPRIPTAFEREVEAAVKAERIEIHLQPIVTLPQRKVRFYEVLSRLKGGDGRLIPAGEFIATAEQRRLIQRIDTFQVIRSFQILKRLTARNREIGLFVNISPFSLVDTGFFREFNAFLAQNRGLSDLVQFEFTQDAMRDMGPLEAESLQAIANLGFRFSLDNVTDLRMDLRGLADQGFRTVKISADRLLGRAPVERGDIHPADLSGHLNRQGITLVVDRIETEAQVIDLLDYEIRYAQGYLFSAPRQVRPEILGAPAAEPPAKTATR